MKRHLTVALGLVLAVVTTSCKGVDDLDRTQAGALRKDIFINTTWYYQQTIVNVPPTDATNVIGYPSNLEKIRWDIQENVLIAYRAYELVPGSDDRVDPNSRYPNHTSFNPDQGQGSNALPSQYKENPIAAFPIESHFDIIREYNTQTGEQGNVLSENTTDNPWYKRQYFRVNWSQNLIKWNIASLTPFVDMRADTSFYVFPHECQAGTGRDENGNCLQPNEDAFRFECLQPGLEQPETFDDVLPSDDPNKGAVPCNHQAVLRGEQRPVYFDFTTKYAVQPDSLGCYFGDVLGFGAGRVDCTSSEVSVRNSFVMVPRTTTYEPLIYPDDVQAKFGLFVNQRPTYNRHRGYTETGVLRLAARHNIWKRLDRDEAGNIAPTSIPRPIVYSLSPRFPVELIPAAEQIAIEFNRSFRRVVAAVKGIEIPEDSVGVRGIDQVPNCPDPRNAETCGPDQVPDMFVLDYNGYVKDTNGQYVLDPTRIRARLGDVRFKHLDWIDQPQISGPLGLGGPNADPETGEAISAIAHMYGGGIDELANEGMKAVELLICEGGQCNLDINDFLNGTDVADYIRTNLDRLDPVHQATRAYGPENLAMPADQFADALLGQDKLDRLSSIKTHGFVSAPFEYEEGRVSRIKGTALEGLLVDDEVRAAAGLMGNVGGAELSEAAKARAQMRLDILTTGGHKFMKELNKKLARAARPYCLYIQPQFVDDNVYGLAMEMKEKYGHLPTEERRAKIWNEIRARIFTAVALHEVGHSVGLLHNFQGSWDALNFRPEWWDLRKENLTAATTAEDYFRQQQITERQRLGKMTEQQYSSIMDYNAQFNTDFSGLGRYDDAAVLFAYSGADRPGFVEVFKSGAIEGAARQLFTSRFPSNDPGTFGGTRRAGRLRFESRTQVTQEAILEQYDYSQIVHLIGGGSLRQVEGKNQFAVEGGNLEDGVQKLNQRTLMRWDEVRALQNDPSTDGSRPIEVPYMFCGDDWVGQVVSCHRWDLGANPYEQVQYIAKTYKNYYFFNNFRRNRYPFDSFNSYARAQRYFSYLPNIYQNWVIGRVKGIENSVMDGYWTQAVFDAFNLLFEAVSTPSYGTYVSRRGAINTGDDPQSVNYALLSLTPEQNIDEIFGLPPGTAEQCRATNCADAALCRPTSNAGTPLEVSYDLCSAVSIAPGDGRRVFTRYDYDSGYYLFDQVLETGSFWEYQAAFTALTTASAPRLGVELDSDTRSFLIPWYKVFEKEMNLLANGIFSENYASYGPRLVQKDNCSGAYCAEIRPFRPVTFLGSPDANTGTPIDLNVNFTQRIYALLYPMALFQADYSLHYQDNAHIFQMGSGSQSLPNVEDGFEVITVTDDRTGVTYGAISKVGATDEELTLAARMIRRAQAMKAAATPQNDMGFSFQIELINLMRSMYDIFGRNF